MSFYGVLGEDPSDAEAVAILVRRLRDACGLPPIKIKRHGYEGFSQLMRKGADLLAAWEKAGCVRAVVCRDADGPDGAPIRQRVEKDIIRASKILIPCLPLVPVQEFEAWPLGDIAKLGEVFHWCRGLEQPRHPEVIKDPKEHIIRLTKRPPSGRAFYHPPTHNPVMAGLVDLDAVAGRCPSFAALVAFIRREVQPPDADVLGKWLVVGLVRDGRPEAVERKAPAVAVIDVASVTFRVRSAVYISSLKVDAATTPKTFDMTLENGRHKGAMVRGLYEVNADQLRVCYSRPGQDRPTELSSAEGSGLVLATLKRVKK